MLKSRGVLASSDSPSNPQEGDMYYDTSDKNLYVWNGTDWVVSAANQHAQLQYSTSAGTVPNGGSVGNQNGFFSLFGPYATAVTSDDGYIPRNYLAAVSGASWLIHGAGPTAVVYYIPQSIPTTQALNLTFSYTTTLAETVVADTSVDVIIGIGTINIADGKSVNGGTGIVSIGKNFTIPAGTVEGSYIPIATFAEIPLNTVLPIPNPASQGYGIFLRINTTATLNSVEYGAGIVLDIEIV